MDEKLVIQITAEIAELKKQVAEAKGEVEKFAKDAEGSSAKIDETFKNAGTSIKNGMKVAAVGIAGAVTALVALGPATEEYRRNQALLASAFEATGGSADMAKSAYNDLYRILGDTGQATEAAQQLAQLGLTAEENEGIIYSLQGVYATFGESLPLEGLAEAVNHSAKLGEVQGSLADALEWVGISTEDFNAQLAACSTESERAALIAETLSANYDGAAGAYEGYAASILEGNAAQARLDEAMAATGAAMAPVMTMLKELGADVLTAIQPMIQSFAENYLPVIKDVLSEVGAKLSETLTWVKEHQAILAVIAGVIGTVVAAIGLYNAVAAVKAAMDAAQVASLGALVAAQLASAAATVAALAPYLAIVAAIAAVVAIIVLCVKHWDEIKAKVVEVANNIKEKVSEMVAQVKQKFEEMKAGIQEKVNAAKEVIGSIFGTIVSLIQNKIETAKTIVSNVLAAIKAIFSGDLGAAKTAALNIFDAIANGIKNKINIARDGVKSAIDKIKGFFNFKWELPKIKLPHFSISGKFSLNPPSIPKFSVSWYQKGGVFDDPTLFGYGNGKLGGLGENGAEAVVPLEKNTEWLDKIADKLASKMGGSAPIYLQVDGKTFAQIMCDNVNQITRQRGSIPLILY